MKEVNKLTRLGFESIQDWDISTKFDTIGVVPSRKFLMDGIEVRFNKRDEMADDIIRAPSIILKRQPYLEIMKVKSIVPQIGKGLLEHVAVVEAGDDHHLPVELDPTGGEARQLVDYVRNARIVQQNFSRLPGRRVDRDV